MIRLLRILEIWELFLYALSNMGVLTILPANVMRHMVKKIPNICLSGLFLLRILS